jgi:hypothetical protein
MLVFDTEARLLTSYNVKRGNGSYDAGKRRIILGDLLRTQMLLRDYGMRLGLKPAGAHAHIIFYYGVRSIPEPLSIVGDQLDNHFNFPVWPAVEHVNDYFRRGLHALVEEE